MPVEPAFIISKNGLVYNCIHSSIQTLTISAFCIHKVKIYIDKKRYVSYIGTIGTL